MRLSLVKRSLAIAVLSTLSSLGIAAVAKAQNYAYPDYFTCRQVDGIFTTFAVKGDKEFQIIRWTSGFGAAAGYTPQQRCQEVSNRFDRSVRDGSLRYLTHGTMNNYPVICTASSQGGSCENLIFTLPYNEGYRATQTLRELGDVARGASGALYQGDPNSPTRITPEDVVSEADNGNLYVDFGLFLQLTMDD